MTETDIKNREILLSIFEKNVGFEKKSLEFVKKQFSEPFIDEEFKKNLGPDLRASWPIDLNNLTAEEAKKISDNDKAFNIFKYCFGSFSEEVSFNEFQENIKITNKNKIKIKKYIENIYKKDTKRFFKDAARRGYYYSTDTKSDINIDIEKFILKSFEEIGKYKIPNKKLKLVLSLNYADWLLCSTGETWSSCLSLENCYYVGLFTLPGDLSRALLYVTDGVKKEFLGIKVDRMISRSWILLGKNNEKVIVRFYPNEFLGIDLIKKITKDENYILSSYLKTEIEAKNKYVPLFFEKHISITPYNDRSSLKFSTEGVKQTIKEGSGLTVFDKRFNRQISDIFSKIFSKKFKSYFTEDGCINEDINFKAAECCHCHNSEKNLKQINNELYCEECYQVLFIKCKHCGADILRKENETLCDKCKPFYVKKKCSLCGEESLRKDLIFIEYIEKIKGSGFICSKHNTDIKKCLSCGLKTYSFNLIRLHDEHTKEKNKLLGKWRCFSCFEKEKDRFEKCTVCNELYAKSKIKDGICVNCE